MNEMWHYLEWHDILFMQLRTTNGIYGGNEMARFDDFMNFPPKQIANFMSEIRIIDAEHKQDINIPNEPFSLFGRMIPSYINEQWTYNIVRFKEDEISEMCFPDENDTHVYIGTLQEEKSDILFYLDAEK